MRGVKDSFESLAMADPAAEFSDLTRKPTTHGAAPMAGPPWASTARLRGLALDGQPLIDDVAGAPGEVLPARATVVVPESSIGATVVVVFEDGDPHRPIVIGVVQDVATGDRQSAGAPRATVTLQADGDRMVVSAQQEILLRCGDASITLTQAGKVIIKGNYIVSRSSGYNKIKGAAVDIN